MEQEGYTPHEINEIMNRESGLLGSAACPATCATSRRRPSPATSAPRWPTTCTPPPSRRRWAPISPSWAASTRFRLPAAWASTASACCPHDPFERHGSRSDVILDYKANKVEEARSASSTTRAPRSSCWWSPPTKSSSYRPRHGSYSQAKQWRRNTLNVHKLINECK